MNVTTSFQTVLAHINHGMSDTQAIFKTAVELPLYSCPTLFMVSCFRTALFNHRKYGPNILTDVLSEEKPRTSSVNRSATQHPSLTPNLLR